MDNHTILDADQQPFDSHRTLQYFKCDEQTTKYTIIKKLTEALDEISKVQHDAKTATLGLVQYRLLASTYLLVPCRDDMQLNKQNKLKRIQYYEQKRWNKLTAMLEHEQQKHDDRELRKNHRNNNTPDHHQHNNNAAPTDEQKQIQPSQDNDTSTNHHQFVNMHNPTAIDLKLTQIHC